MKKIGLFMVCMVCMVCIIFGYLSEGPAQTVDDLTFLTEDYPPNNFKADGKLQGIYVDVVEALMKRVKSKLTRKDIRLLPWPNAYKQVQKKKNTALFGMARTKEREALFKFVGPVTNSREVLLARKDAKIRIDGPEDLNIYKIGVIRDDLGEKNVKQAGVEQKYIYQVPKIESIMKMLNVGRIHLWAYSETNAFWQLKNHGYTPENFETVYVFAQRQGYIAFNKETPDTIVKRFQAALDEMHQPGADGGKSAMETIIDSYIK